MKQLETFKGNIIFFLILGFGLILEKMNVMSQLKFFIGVQLVGLVLILSFILFVLFNKNMREYARKNIARLKKDGIIVFLFIVSIIILTFVVSNFFSISLGISYEIVLIIFMIVEIIVKILKPNKQMQ